MLKIQTTADERGEWMLAPWATELLRHNPWAAKDIVVVDYGMSPNGRKTAKALGLTVVKCPKKWLKRQMETLHTLIKSMELPGCNIKLHLDLDCIVQGDLAPIVEGFVSSGKDFGGCADPFYPWTWRPDPKKGTRFLPIMSGVLIFKQPSQVMADWIEALTTWELATRIDGMFYQTQGMAEWRPMPQGTFNIAGPNMAFRDDMQCLSQLYRIGHPAIWEMPEKTQWFRLQGGEPDGYLIAHYTGPEGKKLLRTRFGLEDK